MFKRPRLLAATAAVAASVTVALVGLSAASASPVRPAASGTEHVQLLATSYTNKAPVILYGVVTSGGVDHEGASTDTIDLAGGSLKLRHTEQGDGTRHVNPKTCLVLISEHGTYTISGGTGKYKGISGHGRYQLTVKAIARRAKGKCGPGTGVTPKTFQRVIEASGPLSR